MGMRDDKVFDDAGDEEAYLMDLIAWERGEDTEGGEEEIPVEIVLEAGNEAGEDERAQQDGRSGGSSRDTQADDGITGDSGEDRREIRSIAILGQYGENTES